MVSLKALAIAFRICRRNGLNRDYAVVMVRPAARATTANDVVIQSVGSSFEEFPHEIWTGNKSAVRVEETSAEASIREHRKSRKEEDARKNKRRKIPGKISSHVDRRQARRNKNELCRSW